MFLSLQTEDKTLKLVDNFWHVLTKEPGNEELLADCMTWITDHLTAGRALAGSSSHSSSTGLATWEKVEKDEAVGATA